MLFAGTMISVRSLDGHIAELSFDAPEESVNKLSAAAMAELAQAVAALEAADGLEGVIVTSAKAGFIAGADVAEFTSMFRAGPQAIAASLIRSNDTFNRLEDVRVPVVVAINGFALGGGFELCLACDYRIASAGSVIGLPECSLGIIPGWGGTVRLPRIIGLDSAIEWIALAQQHSSETGLRVGTLDAVVAPEKLREAALHTVRQCIGGKLDYRSRRLQKKSPMRLNATELAMVVESAKGSILARTGSDYRAPSTAIEVLREAVVLDRAAALAIESEAFARLASADEARALVGIFNNDQAVAKRAKDWVKRADKKIERAAVIGAGIMGGGIVYQSAMKDIPIRMKDIAQARLDLGLAEAGKLLAKRVERGAMQAAVMARALSHITPVLNYDGFDAVDIVVEAVVENPEVKKTVLVEVERQVRDGTVLASNTSTISISSLAKALERPGDFCGMHFFNPVHAMQLVEVIRGEDTSDRTIARTVAYACALGKRPIVVKDCPGFLVNRVLFPYVYGFLLLVRDGADHQHVDRVMQKWGWPMGPAHLLDVIGLDVAVHSARVMAQSYPDRMAAIDRACTSVLHEAGRLGQKAGKGFYDYVEDSQGRSKKVPAEAVDVLLKPHVASRRTLGDEEIIARMMVPMATEMARCIDEGIVETAAEADTALILGLGFPRFRGGLMRWMDTVGLKSLCEMADRYAALGAIYQVPENMRRRAAAGGGYYPA